MNDYPFVLLLFAVIAYFCWLMRNVKKVKKKLNSPTPPKLCKDCAYAIKDPIEYDNECVYAQSYLCGRSRGIDGYCPVTGNVFEQPVFRCLQERKNSNLCGPDARFFKSK